MSAYKNLNKISESIEIVIDHPKEGIIFRNISTLLLNYDLTMLAIEYMAKLVKNLDIDYIVGLESRGFLFVTTLADLLSQGFNKKKGTGMIRKPNKLPNTVSESYSKEYGEDVLTIQQELFPVGSKILLVDDLIATGGSFYTGCKLVEKIGCSVVGCLSLIQLNDFDLVEGLNSYKIFSLLQYPKNSITKKISKEYCTLFEEPIKYMPLNNISENDDRIIIFCHPSMQSIANTITSYSNDFRQGTIIWNSFPDNYHNIVFEDLKYLEGKRVVFFGSMYDPKNFTEQLSMILVLPRQRIRSLDIFFPYFGPGTMERVEKEGVLATAETYAQIISTSCQTSTIDGPPKIHIFDIHALPNRHYFNDNVIVCMESAISLLKEKINTNTTIVFPDDGAAKRFKPDFENYTIIVCAKERIGTERHIRISDKHRFPKNKLIQIQKLQNCVIVDDLVQSGETLKMCSIAIKNYYNQLLEESNLDESILSNYRKQNVCAYVTHAIFPERAYQKFFNEQIFDKFYMTNSNPIIADFLDGKNPFEIIRLDDYIKTKLLKSFNLCYLSNSTPKFFNVFVSSTNNTKLSAVNDAFNRILTRRYLNYKLTVYGINTCSNVPEQPINLETRQGCLNRLKNLQKYVEFNNLKCDFLVSIENGINFPYKINEPYDYCNAIIISCNEEFNFRNESNSTIITKFPQKYLNQCLTLNQTITVGKLIEEDLGLAPETWHQFFDTCTSRHDIIVSTIIDVFDDDNYNALSNKQKRKFYTCESSDESNKR